MLQQDRIKEIAIYLIRRLEGRICICTGQRVGNVVGMETFLQAVVYGCYSDNLCNIIVRRGEC